MVIADEEMRVVECNQAFAEMLGAESLLAYEACPGMGGVSLSKLLPTDAPFRHVLKNGDALLDHDMRLAGRFLHAHIIRKAQQVIRKNLTTVQQIACLLGENAAESEMIMAILPVCHKRGFAYSTFTIVDAGRDGSTVLVEYDNPPALWMRGAHSLSLPRREIRLRRPDGQEDRMTFRRFHAREGDRLVLFSDGITQAGMGAESTPLGWGLEGIDLVTEGTLTLAEVLRLLETPADIERARPHGARRMAEMMCDSDVIHFLVGTRINEAHQDPDVPVELDIRRNLVRHMRRALESTFLKETHLAYI